jgi:hypothetical protein
MNTHKTQCEGTGQHGVPHTENPIYPACPVCGREFSAQGRKAQARLGNPWQSVPRHFR